MDSINLGTVQVTLPHSAASRFVLVAQIGCSLIGSVGALYNGVLLINLAVSLFALVAIESSSQSLGRTYAVLLVCAIVLDIAWFVLFFREIWYADWNLYLYFYFDITLVGLFNIFQFSCTPSLHLACFLLFSFHRLPLRSAVLLQRKLMSYFQTFQIHPCDCVCSGTSLRISTAALSSSP